MKVLILILLMVLPVVPQHSHEDSSFSRFDNMRLLPPVSIIHYDDAYGELRYRVDTGKEIKLGVFQLSKETKIDESVRQGKHKGKLFWVVWCYQDSFVYFVREVAPEQIKK